MVHVSVKAESILTLFGVSITNSIILSWIVIGLFLLLSVYYSKSLHKRHKSKMFYLMHTVVLAVFNLVKSVLHDKAVVFFPLLGAFFFYILINNWFGMLPTVGSVLIAPYSSNEKAVVLEKDKIGEDLANYESIEHSNDEVVEEESGHSLIPLFRAGTADLNTTFALALTTVLCIQYFGFKYNGLGYLKKFFNFSSPIMFFVGILELISEIARILSFSFRLFGNVLAGEILITIVAFLLPSVASFIMVPFFTLEIMAGAIQALVFMMLSTVLIGMATAKAQH